MIIWMIIVTVFAVVITINQCRLWKKIKDSRDDNYIYSAQLTTALRDVLIEKFETQKKINEELFHRLDELKALCDEEFAEISRRNFEGKK